MHEMSVVESLVKLVEKYANNKKVSKIVVKVGKLSGIEPYFLKECFEVFKENTICSEAKMEIVEIEKKIFCEDCKKEFEIRGFDFRCPNCKSENTKLIAGNELYIDYIEIKE